MEQQNDVAYPYLTFHIGEEKFGAHVSQVLNILEMIQIIDVPKSPDYMKGVINLRGKVLPVIDLRLKFGLSETDYTYSTCIIVMDLELDKTTIHLGMIVDEVLSVVEIEQKQMEPQPSIGNKYKSEFIFGMANVDDQFIMLLDMQQILKNDEIGVLAGALSDMSEKLKEVVVNIQNGADNIAAASSEMNNGADQVNSSIQQLNEVTQQNAASSEELATSAEELSSQAEQLKQVTSFFKLEAGAKERYQSKEQKKIDVEQLTNQQTGQQPT